LVASLFLPPSREKRGKRKKKREAWFFLSWFSPREKSFFLSTLCARGCGAPPNKAKFGASEEDTVNKKKKKKKGREHALEGEWLPESGSERSQEEKRGGKEEKSER